jgi:hypothetical protein
MPARNSRLIWTCFILYAIYILRREGTETDDGNPFSWSIKTYGEDNILGLLVLVCQGNENWVLV